MTTPNSKKAIKISDPNAFFSSIELTEPSFEPSHLNNRQEALIPESRAALNAMLIPTTTATELELLQACLSGPESVSEKDSGADLQSMLDEAGLID